MQTVENTSNNKRENAIDAINQGMTIRSASKKFDIPRSTIHRAVTESIVLSKGGQTYLTVEIEQELIHTAEYLSERGFGLTLEKFLELATDVVNSTKTLSKPLTLLSRDWWIGFKSRHPNFICCRPKGRVVTSKSDAEQNEEGILSFYEQYENLNLKFNFTPSQVWNADETGSCQKENSSYIVANKNQKTIGSRVSSNATHMTLLACICANGSYSPPLFICKDKSLDQTVLDKAIPESMVMTSSSGYINETIFNEWFLKWITSIRKQTSLTILLIVDNCSSHVRHSTISLAKNNNVELLALPPNLTHVLQPLDVSMFRSFKAKIRSSLANALIFHKVNKLNHGQFIEMQCQIITEIFTSDSIKSSFKTIGLFPIDANKAFERVGQGLILNKVNTAVEKKQDTISELRCEVNELKTEIAKLHSKDLISTVTATKRPKKLKSVLAHVLTQSELKENIIPLPKSKVQPEKRKLSLKIKETGIKKKHSLI